LQALLIKASLVIAVIGTLSVAIAVVAFLWKRFSTKKSQTKADVEELAPAEPSSSLDAKKQDCAPNGFNEVQFSNFVGSEIKDV
jgi:hypothetical protein